MDTGDLLVIFPLEFIIYPIFLLLSFVDCIWWVQGLNYSAPGASSIEESNALALAIIPTESGKLCFLFFLSFPPLI